jgi:hypothetical protein
MNEGTEIQVTHEQQIIWRLLPETIVLSHLTRGKGAAATMKVHG